MISAKPISAAVFILVIFTLASCAVEREPLKKIPTDVSYFGFDFTRYAEKGFHVTPEYYNGKYTPVGLVAVEMYPEANYIVKGIIQTPDGPVKNFMWVTNNLDGQNAIDSLVEMSMRMGADALVNFRYSSEQKSYSSIPNPITLTGFRVEGFAIKREE